MFRRSRFSVRPNVSTTVRPVPKPQEAPPVNQEGSVAPRESGDSNVATALTDKSNVTLTEKAAVSGDGNDQNVEGASSSAAVQRRKRFSVKPKVAPGRSSTLSRTPKSPVKAVSQTAVECSGSDLKPTTSSQTGTTAFPKGLQSPRRRRPSEDSKQPKMQHKPAPISLDTSEPSAVSSSVHAVEQTHLPADSSKQSENISDRQVKEAPPRPPDRPSLPDKESTELSEKAKTLVTSKSVLSLTPSALSLSRLLNDPSDLQRLVKAQKLRELLREERRKEKKLKKAKFFPKVYSLDPAKMTMSDLIHYLPTSNPMTSSVEDLTQENETVLPPSPGRGVSPEHAQEPEVLPNTVSNREEEEEGDEEQEEALMVPQVKVAEDGSLIIDEESLTVEVQRAKGPNPAENRDPIFERGSTTTYSSFRKLNHAKRWTSEETDMFFLAVSMVGTDFSMICQLFPHRGRSEIKNKFKKEERVNSWRIDKAIRERRKLDIEYFSKLLEKILEYQKSKKKLKSLTEKNSSQKGKRKTEAKKSASTLSDVEEEEDEEDENEVLDLGEEEEEEEGEKENEELCNDGEIPVSEAKTKRGKRKNRQIALDEGPNDKKNKRVSTEQGEDGIPEDTEAGLPQNHKDPDMSEKTQNVNTAKDTAVKPAKLSRGRAPKPLLPLGCKWSKKPTPCVTAKNTSLDKEEESVNKDASSLSQARVEIAGDDMSSEEEDVIVKPPRPTRCGRVPKPIKPLTYPAKEDVHSSASDTTPSSAVGSTASAAKPKSKQTAKRRLSPQPDSVPKSKKFKLVTLTASQTEFSDEEGHQWQDDEVEEVELAGSPSKDSSAPVFVPAGLHTPRPQIKEVDETIAELDILATMPDVLGISHDALCPDSACEQAQHETGSAEPCEHQLDLLIDVIDFISSDNAEEVSEDQSYNEAAQTLLTIGNPTHVSQLAQNPIIIPDHITGEASAGVNETGHLEKELTSKPAVQEKSATPSASTFGQDITQTSETVATAKQQDSITDSGEMSIIKTGDEPNPESSNKNSPQSKTGCFSKVKPKPNLGRISRTAQAKSQSEISPVRTAEESNTIPPNITVCSPALLKSDISSAEVKLPVEPSDSQPDVDGVESGAAMSEQSSSEIQSHCSSEFQFELSKDQATRETEPLSEPTDEKLGSPVETAEIGFKDTQNSDSLITETGQESCTNLHPAKESGDKPPPCVSPEVTNTCQSRRSRLQKVKPKPNLSQTSRTVRSKPQTTTQPEVRDLIPNSTFHTKAIGEPTCTTSKEQRQNPDHDSVKPLLNLGSALTPPEELSTNEEKKSDVGPQQSIQENQNSESQFEHSEQPASNTGSTSDTVEKITSHVGTTKSTCDKVVTSDSAVTVSQVGQGANVDLAPVQEGGEVVSTSQLRRTRLPKLKPKPNLPQTSRTARFKPQASKQPEERDPVPTQDPKFHKQTIMGPQPQSSCTASPEQQSQSADPAAVLKPTLDSDSTRIHGEELSTNEEKNADGGLDLGAVISDCSGPEYQSSESQFELKKDRITDTKPSSEPTEENVKSYVGTDNSATSDLVVTEVEQESCTDLDRGQESTAKAPSCVSPAEDLPVRQKGASEVTTTCQSRRSRLQKVKPKPNLVQTSRISRCKPQTTKQAGEKDASPTQNTRLPETTIADVEPQLACTPSSEKQSENTDPTSGNVVSSLTLLEELPANEDKNVRLDLGATTSDQSAPENQNLCESQVEPSRDTKSSSEPQKNVPCVGTAKSTCKNMVTPDSAVTVSQARKGEDAGSSSVQESSVHQAVLVTPVEELPLNQEKSEVESTPQLSQIKPNPSLPQTSRAMQSKSKSESTKDPVMHLQVEEKSCSQTCVPESTDYKTKDAEAQPACIPNSPEKSNQFKGPDTGSVSEPSVELGSTHKYREELSSAEKEKTDVVCGPMSSSASLEQTVPQRSRRFPKVRPKPNLGSSTRITRTKPQPAGTSKPTQHCSVDTISNITSGQQPGDNNNAQKLVKFTEKDPPSGQCSFNAEGCSVLDTTNTKDSHPADPHSSLGCLAQVNEQQGEHDCPSNNSQVPVVSVTQVSYTQNASSTKDIQSYPIFQNMLPEQVPSDPDEPFFILSLTEIPLSSSGEVVHSATDHPSCFSAAESSIPQPSSVSGESVAATGDVPMPVFTEKKGEMGLINVKDNEPDPSVFFGHAVEKKVDPHESTTDHPPKFPATVDNNETEIPLTKQSHTATGRRAKLQVKSSSVRRKQTSKTLSAEAAESAPTHTNTTRDVTHSVPSVVPKPYDATTEPQMGNSSHDKEILTDRKGTNSSLGAQSSQSSGSAHQRRPRDSLSSLPLTNRITPSQNLPPRKPASKRSKVKTPLAEGKQPLLEPVASTSHDVASTLKPLKETHSTSVTVLTQTPVEIKQTADSSDQASITLQCTDEQSDCMDSSFLEEEPTSVSQYFLSDIFTEVEEG